MAGPFGITAAGFVKPQLSDIQDEVNKTLRSKFGEDINTSAGSFFGQISGVMSERESKVWDAMQDVYGSQVPDQAFGASLDNVGALRGVPRLGARKSTVQGVKLFGTAGTPIPGLSTQFSVQNAPSSVFRLDGDVVLGAGQSCIQTVGFSAVPTAGQWALLINGTQTPWMAWNANAAAVQAAIRALRFCSGCTVTGTYPLFTVNFLGAGTGGFMIQPLFAALTDGLVTGAMMPVVMTPLITQAGVDQANVNATALDTGPMIANAGTLNVINTPVSGLTAVLNTLDAVVGRDVEKDGPYLARQNQELQISGAGTFEAIRSKLLQLNGVTAAFIFENDTDVVDSGGRPPHSFEVVVQGGTDADIAALLWATKPAGIRTVGAIPMVVVDSQGQDQTVYFSRPEVLPIYIVLQVRTNASYPLNGDATATQLLVDSGNALGIGKDVITIPKLISAIGQIPGIIDATLLIGLAPAPTTSDNVLVGLDQISAFDTGRVTVVHV
jgi:uncharacterized phage protein gp47/JayE